MMTAGNDAAATEQSVTLTRVFTVTRSLVNDAWTKREHVQQWWAPGMFSNPLLELDVQPGGALRIHMQGPDGMDAS
jgi:uncharacterized protein YndB with AHSA1/START domain